MKNVFCNISIKKDNKILFTITKCMSITLNEDKKLIDKFNNLAYNFDLVDKTNESVFNIVYDIDNEKICPIISLIKETKLLSKTPTDDLVRLEIDNKEYFEMTSNIQMFDFVDELIITPSLKFSKINLNLFPNAKYIKLLTDPVYLIKSLPVNLIELEFYSKYNKPINWLPDNLQLLKLGNYFDSSINISDSNVKKIFFGSQFNQPVDNLSNYLIVIKFGYKFNKSVNLLPSSLKEIYFGKEFNQSVDNLPSSLILLEFSNDFNQSVDNLPNGLKYIRFKGNSLIKFNQSINNLPESVEQIELLNEKYSNQIKKLPKSLKKIYILNKYAYSICKKLNIENRLNIKNQIHKQNLDCEIIII